MCPGEEDVVGGVSHVEGKVVSVTESNKGCRGGQWVDLGVLEKVVSAQ